MNYITKREKRVRLALIRDLIRMNMLTCRPISLRRSTSLLPATIDARRKAANAETVTCATEHAQ